MTKKKKTTKQASKSIINSSLETATQANNKGNTEITRMNFIAITDSVMDQLLELKNDDAIITKKSAVHSLHGFIMKMNKAFIKISDTLSFFEQKMYCDRLAEIEVELQLVKERCNVKDNVTLTKLDLDELPKYHNSTGSFYEKFQKHLAFILLEKQMRKPVSSVDLNIMKLFKDTYDRQTKNFEKLIDEEEIKPKNYGYYFADTPREDNSTDSDDSYEEENAVLTSRTLNLPGSPGKDKRVIQYTYVNDFNATIFEEGKRKTVKKKQYIRNERLMSTRLLTESDSSHCVNMVGVYCPTALFNNVVFHSPVTCRSLKHFLVSYDPVLYNGSIYYSKINDVFHITRSATPGFQKTTPRDFIMRHQYTDYFVAGSREDVDKYFNRVVKPNIYIHRNLIYALLLITMIAYNVINFNFTFTFNNILYNSILLTFMFLMTIVYALVLYNNNIKYEWNFPTFGSAGDAMPVQNTIKGIDKLKSGIKFINEGSFISEACLRDASKGNAVENSKRLREARRTIEASSRPNRVDILPSWFGRPYLNRTTYTNTNVSYNLKDGLNIILAENYNIGQRMTRVITALVNYSQTKSIQMNGSIYGITVRDNNGDPMRYNPIKEEEKLKHTAHVMLGSEEIFVSKLNELSKENGISKIMFTGNLKNLIRDCELWATEVEPVFKENCEFMISHGGCFSVNIACSRNQKYLTTSRILDRNLKDEIHLGFADSNAQLLDSMIYSLPFDKAFDFACQVYHSKFSIYYRILTLCNIFMRALSQHKMNYLFIVKCFVYIGLYRFHSDNILFAIVNFAGMNLFWTLREFTDTRKIMNQTLKKIALNLFKTPNTYTFSFLLHLDMVYNLGAFSLFLLPLTQILEHYLSPGLMALLTILDENGMEFYCNTSRVFLCGEYLTTNTWVVHTYLYDSKTGKKIEATRVDDYCQLNILDYEIPEDVIFKIPIQHDDNLLDYYLNSDRVIADLGKYSPINNCITFCANNVSDLTYGFTLSLLVWCYLHVILTGFYFSMKYCVHLNDLDDYKKLVWTDFMRHYGAMGSDLPLKAPEGSFSIWFWNMMTSVRYSMVQNRQIEIGNYPTGNIHSQQLRYVPHKLMCLNVNNLMMRFNYPQSGLHRRSDYKSEIFGVYRDGSVNLTHGLNTTLEGEYNQKDSDIIDDLHSEIMKYKFEKSTVYYVTSVTAERINDFSTTRFQNLVRLNKDRLIILTNSKDIIDNCGFDVSEFKVIILPNASGGQLRSLRACLPDLGCFWFSLNCNLPSKYANYIATILNNIHLQKNDNYLTYSYLHFANASQGFLLYQKGLDIRNSDLSAYGCEEMFWRYREGHVFTDLDTDLFRRTYKEGELVVNLNIHFIDRTSESPVYVGSHTMTKWNSDQLILCLRNKMFDDRIMIFNSHMNKLHNLVKRTGDSLSTAANFMYKNNDAVKYLTDGLTYNTKATCDAIESCLDKCAQQCSEHKIGKDMINTIDCFEDILKDFTYDDDSMLMKQNVSSLSILKEKYDQNGLILNDNPKFYDQDVEENINSRIHLLNHFNHKDNILPTDLTFVRKVNRCPYISDTLKSLKTYKAPRLETKENGDVELVYDTHYIDDDIDGQVFANRQFMLASAVRYVKEAPEMVMLDEDALTVATAIVDSKPNLYRSAQLANPEQLVKHFLKHPSYSAGLPFIGMVKGKPFIKSRRQLRAAGFTNAISKAARYIIQYGLYTKSLAHLFPKSEVVPWEKKLKIFPHKVRTVTATSCRDNIIKGVFHFDINNRHDYSSFAKVGMPLRGSEMSAVAEQIDKYKYIISMDVSAFDAQLDKNLMKIATQIRKLGYEDHQHKDIIYKHLDRLEDMTRNGHIINLIDETYNDVYTRARDDVKAKFDEIPDEVLKRTFDMSKHDLITYTNRCPGGVINKRIGGYTGDSDTTWNNTQLLQSLIIYSFWKVYDIHPKEFIKTSIIANVGDDNITGTNIEIDDKDFATLRDFVKKTFDMELRVESSGNKITDQTFLGKSFFPSHVFKQEFEQYNIEPPKYAVIHDPERLMRKFKHFKIEVARNFRNTLREYSYLMETAIGYAQLCAHQPEKYAEIAKHYDTWQKLFLQAGGKMTKRLYLPSYSKVLFLWYKPLQQDQTTFKKLMIRSVESFDSRLSTKIDHIYTMIGNLPDLLQLDISATNPEKQFSTGIVEGFVYFAHVNNFGERPSLSQVERDIRLSPFKEFTNPSKYITRLDAQPIDSFNLYRNKYIQLAFTTSLSKTIINCVSFIPFVGRTVRALLRLLCESVPRLMKLTDSLAYYATGMSGDICKELISRDIRYVYKFVGMAITATITNNYIYDKIMDAVNISVLTDKLLKILRKINFFNRLSIHAPSRNNKMIGLTEKEKTWENFSNSIWEFEENGKCIVSPPGSGKTLFLPYHLLDKMYRGKTINRILIVQPRNLLCENIVKSYKNKYNLNVHYFRKSKSDHESIIGVCTYGYLSAILKTHGNLTKFDDYLVILDEIHEANFDKTYVRKYLISNDTSFLQMTATPPTSVSTVEVDIQSDYVVTRIERVGEDPYVIYKDLIKDPKNKVLLIHPARRDVMTKTQALNKEGYNVQCLLGNSENTIDSTANYIGTSVVDSGITIPNLTHVVDYGYQIVNDGGTLKYKFADKATQVQRAGRTGRTNNGIYIYCGKTDQSQPTEAYSLQDLLSGSNIHGECGQDHLDKNLTDNKLCDDEYAFIPTEIDKSLFRVFNYCHKIVLHSASDDLGFKTFENHINNVKLSDQYLLGVCDLSEGELFNTKFKDIKALYLRFRPYYVYDNIRCNRLMLENNMIIPFKRREMPRPSVN
jgi:hypothetical protein